MNGAFRDGKNTNSSEEIATFISRERANCEECRKLLRETSLVVEMSNIGQHVSGFIRFENGEVERRYEEHLLAVHGLAR